MKQNLQERVPDQSDPFKRPKPSVQWRSFHVQVKVNPIHHSWVYMKKIHVANFPNPLPRETDNKEMYSHWNWTTKEYILLDKKNYFKSLLGLSKPGSLKNIFFSNVFLPQESCSARARCAKVSVFKQILKSSVTLTSEQLRWSLASRFGVYDDNGKLLGQRILPFDDLQVCIITNHFVINRHLKTCMDWMFHKMISCKN